MNMKVEDLIFKSPLWSNDKKVVVYRGRSNPLILFVGEAPGQDENRSGTPFIGRSGKVLDNWLHTFSIYNYSGITNSVPLIPLTEAGSIRKPTNEEIDYFKPFLKEVIIQTSPKLIICLGDSAVYSLTKKRIIQMKFDIDRTNEYRIPTTAIYHPSYYLRRGEDGINDFKYLYENIILEVLPQVKSITIS